jgi:hypothetical protein
MLHTLHSRDVRMNVSCIVVILLRKLNKQYGDFTKYFGLIFIDEESLQSDRLCGIVS